MKKLETVGNTIIDNIKSREYKFHLHPALTVYTEVSYRMVECTLATILRDKMFNTVSRTVWNIVFRVARSKLFWY